jgi:hypothetical protein
MALQRKRLSFHGKCRWLSLSGQPLNQLAFGRPSDPARTFALFPGRSTRIGVGQNKLATFPVSGRSGRVSGTRELVVPNTPFIAAYAIDEERTVILALYYGAQHWPEVF